MEFHFWTQPLPTPLAWYASLLPKVALDVLTAVVLGIELAVPMLIFGTRRAKHVACGLLLALQVVIAATGNYAFFNILSAALCLLLLDDRVIGRLARGRGGPFSTEAAGLVRRGLLIAFALVTVPVSFGLLLDAVGMPFPGRSLISPAAAAVAPFQSVSSYGLFAVMTTTRPEIAVEGSNDGTTWLAYGFKYKPDDERRRPGWVAPHQPRLDWQFWFAALGRYETEPWLQNFCARLLQGSPEVIHLLGENPFPARPPRYVRASLYRYRFTDPDVRRSDRRWWIRERVGDYSPILSLETVGAVAR
jgi:hypothetical protein